MHRSKTDHINQQKSRRGGSVYFLIQMKDWFNTLDGFIQKRFCAKAIINSLLLRSSQACYLVLWCSLKFLADWQCLLQLIHTPNNKPHTLCPTIIHTFKCSNADNHSELWKLRIVKKVVRWKSQGTYFFTCEVDQWAKGEDPNLTFYCIKKGIMTEMHIQVPVYALAASATLAVFWSLILILLLVLFSCPRGNKLD